ncbi:MAG: Uma2 family endonuclease [Acidothermales bacterium]|nr:Uma2 family endonuclease [Acidothermales bacterium]
MKTVVLGERPRQLEEWLARRRELGQDRFDEVWEGEYHAAPAPQPRHGYLAAQLVRRLGERADAAGLVGTGAFNLGEPDDYRVPDHGYHHELPTATYVPTAAVVVEVVSPDDETYEKVRLLRRARGRRARHRRTAGATRAPLAAAYRTLRGEQQQRATAVDG